MPKPVEAHVSAVLSKRQRHEKLHEALNYGWQRRTSCPDHAIWERKGTRAAVVWEGTIQKAKELFAEDPGCKILALHDTMSFIFDDSVFLRFKKADFSLQTRNYPTPLHEMFDQHEEDLFGYSGLQRVEAVYVLDAYELNVTWCGIIATDNGQPLWHYELEHTSKVAGTVAPRQQTDTSTLATLKSAAPAIKTGTKSTRTKFER